MKLYPCNSPVSSGISLVSLGKGVYELDRTANVGAELRNPDDGEAEMIFSVTYWNGKREMKV